MKVRRRYHFNTTLAIYVFVTLLVALGAFNSQNNLLFWAFGFALAVLLVSGFISGQMMMGLVLERQPVARGAVGEPLKLRYRVTNKARLFHIFAVGIRESNSAVQPAPSTFLIHAGPRQAIYVESVLTPAERGRLLLAGVEGDTSFPFGIIRKSVTFEQPDAAIIRPARIPLPAHTVNQALGDAQGSSPRRPRPGWGDEYFSLREYAPGDSVRSIAWRASARAGNMLVRQHATPSPHRLWIVPHLNPADLPASERALSIAAELVRLSVAKGYEVGLAISGTPVYRTPRRSDRHTDAMLDDLALIEIDSITDNSFPTGAASARSQCVVVHAGPAERGFGPPHAAHISAGTSDHAAGPVPPGPPAPAAVAEPAGSAAP